MFNAATGRIRLNWKVLAGLTGAMLTIALITCLGPQEPEAIAAVTARPIPPRHPSPDDVRQAPHVTARPVPHMVEEPVHSGRPVVTAAPRPTVHASATKSPAVVHATPVHKPGAPAAPTATPSGRPSATAGHVSAVPAAHVNATPAAPQPPAVAAPPATPAHAAVPAAPATARPTSPSEESESTSRPAADAQGPKTRDYLTETYNFNMRDANWKDVLEYFSRHTGLSILGDTQDLNGPVEDFYHPEPMKFREAFRFFNRLLVNQQRIALLRKDHIQIVKVTGSTAWLRYLDLDRMFDSYAAFKAADLPQDEKCVVFYTPQQVDGPDLVDRFRVFAPDYMLIQPVGDSNELMVAGQAIDVDRWLQIVQRPTTEDLRQTRRFELKNVQPTEVRNMLNTMFSTRGASTGNVRSSQGNSGPRIASDKIDIWADDQTSSLVVKASPRKLEEIAKLIDTVDVDSPEDTSMQVYKLEHARAEELANTLRQVFNASGPSRRRRPTRRWLVASFQRVRRAAPSRSSRTARPTAC